MFFKNMAPCKHPNDKQNFNPFQLPMDDLGMKHESFMVTRVLNHKKKQINP